MKVLIVCAVLLVVGCASDKPRVTYVKQHPELDAETKRRITAGEVVLGMPAEHVMVALGGPIDMRRDGDGTEYWEYHSAILIFKKGVLANWVDKKTLY